MDQNKINRTVERMSEARAALVKDYPFFGHLCMGLRLACAPCSTACTDGRRLIFDPDFADSLTEQEMQFVVLHEVLHCVLEHCIRGKSLHSSVYNIACDIVVNSIILDMWGLDSFAIEGEEVMHLTPEGEEGRLYNAEEIYHMLLKQPEKNPPEAGKGDMPDGAIDRHDLWQGICDREQLRDEIRARIREAAKCFGNSAEMPQSVRKVVRELTRHTGTDWKQLLHDFLHCDQYDYTFLPPDRRYAGADFYLPAFNADDEDGSADEIWVCVDTSGSITDEELTCAMEEILDAMRQTHLRGKLSFFDSMITDPEPFETEEELKKLVPMGGGGTSFRIIFDYLRNRLYPDMPKAILIFTDGYAEWPEEQVAMDVPVLWLISRDGNDDVPWGRVARFETLP